ncbi:hypothetical protein CRYUN_Cryun39dG0066700 [Craigia yunnanensis]
MDCSSRGFFKLNVDAAYFSHLSEATLGMVLRNHAGTILHYAVTRVGAVDSPLHAEFMAILFGLEECRSNGITSLYIESNSLLAIQETKVDLGSFSEWGGIILNVLSLTMHYNLVVFVTLVEQ